MRLDSIVRCDTEGGSVGIIVSRKILDLHVAAARFCILAVGKRLRVGAVCGHLGVVRCLIPRISALRPFLLGGFHLLGSLLLGRMPDRDKDLTL